MIKAPTIEGLRLKTTPVQKELFDEFWESYRTKAAWPMARTISSDYGPDIVKKELNDGNIVREEREQNGWTVFKLSLIGILLTSQGPAYQKLLLRYLEYQRDLFWKHPTRLQIESKDIARDLGLSSEDVEMLGTLVSIGHFFGGSGSRGDGTWMVSAMKEAEDFPKTGDLTPILNALIFRYYREGTPVFGEDSRNFPYANIAPHFGNIYGSPQDSTLIPVAVQDSLNAFKKDYPDPKNIAFIMMQFADTPAHNGIEEVIKATLEKHGFIGLLARDKEYNEDIWANIQTYLHGCAFGIAVFERIQQENFNPNVSLEVGYMMGQKKKVLLLKDQTLRLLQTDLVGRLYRSFDVQRIPKTLPRQIEGWMEDKGFI